MRILIVASHADDETLGMGGTMAKYAHGGHDVVVAVMTGHGEEEPHPLWPRTFWDTIRAECKEALKILGTKEIIFEEIPAARVSEQPPWKLNRITAGVVDRVTPDVLYVPFPLDLHVDHRAIFHSLSVSWRPVSEIGRNIREIYAYEVLSETHWNIPYVEQGFLPNAWVDIRGYLDKKIEALSKYKSQMRAFPDSRSLEAVRALAAWRGSQIGVHAAEGFVLVRKIS